ncbi:hypothetical protein JTE90_000406 [Oedothorax gibbosus]|uniref:Uncharacterized protein n=1 Tax=Oedothorax gibbosus TaxID=931172 RepID=A0AAV6URJ1_9ARAC|nr:hypothetical protein JTE90_000406 [Oedothorax gibbosus]
MSSHTCATANPASSDNSSCICHDVHSSSDESRFQMFHADGRHRAWRTPHEAMDPACQVGAVQAGGLSVIVWGAFLWHGMGPLVVLDATLTDALDVRLMAVNPQPTNRPQLAAALQDVWCQLPPDVFQSLADSLPRRIVALRRARGDPIPDIRCVTHEFCSVSV